MSSTLVIERNRLFLSFMLYLNGALSSGYARYDVALCLISMTDPVGGGINETQSHGEADSPRAYSVNVAAGPSVVR